MGTRPTGITFRDIYLHPRQSTLRSLPAELRAGNVRALTDASGLIPGTAGAMLQRIGRRLFRSLVQSSVAFSPAARRRQQADPSLRTRVWIVLRDPQGDAQPWEVLCNPDGGPHAFLGCDPTTAIVRTLDSGRSRQILPPLDGPLRVLGVIAKPRDAEPLDVSKEKRALQRALAGAQRMGLVELAWVDGPDTAGQLRRKLRSQWHILHFIGHGDFDSLRNLGVLVFEDEARQRHIVPANLLGGLLRSRGIRLVVLNSCRGAFARHGGLLTSTAAQLALDVPAVVAMQTSISDLAAIRFAGEFYERLVEGLTIELAVAEARFDLALRSPTTAIEWPAPVVYLSGGDNVLKLHTVKARVSEEGIKNTKARRRAARRAGRTSSGDIAAVPLKTADVDDDDPQKGQWGGLPSNGGRTLEAKVTAIDADWYRIRLTVRTNRGKKKLTGAVRFHLHDSFPDPVRTVTARDGTATLTLVAYGAFTVGAEADGGRTKLELDLSELAGAPKGFRES
jgi:hypothetical protein